MEDLEIFDNKTGLELKYFVLKPRSKFHKDPYAHASRMAMLTYAEHIRREANERLAVNLEAWVKLEEIFDEKLKEEENVKH